jgi:hypothetical protein
MRGMLAPLQFASMVAMGQLMRFRAREDGEPVHSPLIRGPLFTLLLFFFFFPPLFVGFRRAAEAMIAPFRLELLATER